MIVEKHMNIIVLYPVNSDGAPSDDLTDDERTDYILFVKEVEKINYFEIKEQLVEGVKRHVLYSDDPIKAERELVKVFRSYKEKGYLYPLYKRAVDTTLDQTDPFVKTFVEEKVEKSKWPAVIVWTAIALLSFIVTSLVYSVMHSL